MEISKSQLKNAPDFTGDFGVMGKIIIPFIKFFQYQQIMTTVLLMTLFFVAFQPSVSNSEFYEYIDENGVKTYTDDESAIHSTENKKMKVHKERYDHLDEQQKNELIQKEQKKRSGPV